VKKKQISAKNHRLRDLARRLKKRFGPEVKSHQSTLVIAYLFSLIAVGASVLTPWALKLTIDNFLDPATRHETHWFGLNLAPQTWIILIAMGYFLLYAIDAMFRAANKVLVARVRENLNLTIRDKVLSHIQSLPSTIRMKYRSGELVLRMVGDVYIFTRLLTKTIPMLFEHSATALFTLSIMFLVEPRLGLLGVFLFAGLFFLVKRYGKLLRKTTRQKRRHEGSVAGLAQEIIRNLPFIQALGREQHTRAQFRRINAESLAAGVQTVQTAANMQRTLKIAKGLAMTTMLGGGALLVLNQQLTVGELTMFMAYLNKLTKPADKINDLTDSAMRGLAGGEQIDRLMSENVIQSGGKTPLDLPKIHGLIELKNVWFAYPHSRDRSGFVLKGLNMTLRPNRLTLLMGASGSGKSTVLSLLLRMFTPTAGEIRLDGIPVSRVSSKTLRENVSVTLQQAYLFSGTLRDALLADDSIIPEEQIWDALALVDMADFVRKLPRGLDTELVEEGLNMSGGQQKRLSLARAFLLNRPVLLLDEPLANVDEQSAAVIINALKRIRIGRTCLVISHNPVLVDIADDVIALENGRVAPAFADEAVAS